MQLIAIKEEAEALAAQHPPELQPFMFHLGLDRAVVHAGAGDRPIRESWKFLSYEDLVLHYGDPARVAPIYCPDEFGHMEVRQCFANAYDIATNFEDEFTYVEGFAQASGSPFLVRHAWVLDGEGRIVDPTWANLDRSTEATYLGIRFAADFIRRRAIATGWLGVIAADWRIDCATLHYGLITDPDGLVVGGRVN